MYAMSHSVVGVMSHSRDVYYDRFSFMENDLPYHKSPKQGRRTRQLLSAMVAFADDVMANITTALKQRGMWSNTLIALQSDNGGLAFTGSNHVGSNYPLRGSKMHNFEGGIRVNSFVSGGFIQSKAPRMVGATLNGLVATADFYATFCALAGQHTFDAQAYALGLPLVDGINQWQYWSGANSSAARTQLFGSIDMVIDGEWKYIAKATENGCWGGPVYPNASTTTPPCNTTDCGEEGGCLFQIFEDPTEHVNLAQQLPQKVAEMAALLVELNKGYFNPVRGQPDVRGCDQSVFNGNYWGPFLP